VDVDGTLIRTDLLWECFLVMLKRRPWALFLLPFWLLRGRAVLKKELARRDAINPATLPYRSEIVEFLRAERAAGRRLVLVSACAQELAQSLAAYLGFFDLVLASDGSNNLKGKRKAALLRQQFGERGFAYIGNSRTDLAVWEVAEAAYVVGGPRLRARAARLTEVRGVFPVERVTLHTWIAALRGYHWFKNGLLFLPMALAHRITLDGLARTFAGFVLFGMSASGIYILNDLLDLHSDRGHPWKQMRPFAAGDISIGAGIAMAGVLLAIALPCAFLLNIEFGMLLVGYTMLTMFYSLFLKQIVLLDAFVLSSFYSIRIWGGALITAVPLSHWFLSFSLFIFLSLAMAKRYSELLHAATLVDSGNSGRGYRAEDRYLLMNLGIASGFSAVVIFSLYVHSAEVLVLYRTPQPLLLLSPVLAYWLSRIWLKASRGQLNDDPVTLAIRDPGSYAVAIVTLIILALGMAKLS